MSNIVWESKLDTIYNCQVTRTDEYKGILKLTNTENDWVLVEQEVSLSYGAKFGPDIDDVAQWQEICIQAVDNQ